MEFKRHRRLRKSLAIRELVRENSLSAKDFIFPMFVVEGENIKKEIPTIPGNYHVSVDRLNETLEEAVECGINGVIFFGLPEHKDECGSSAFDENGVIQKAVRKTKELYPNLWVITDVCMCEYTNHGHCGILHGHEVHNDKTLEVLGKVALSHVKAGADMVAPSDMMDGRVAYIRKVLDENGYEDVSIMAYSAKYSSAFYGPFREAANSAPQFGDRKGYQMDPANINEAMREIQSDIEEGADIIMVKPALSYLDVVRWTKDRYDYPVAAYSVSGEFAMVKAASRLGFIDERAVALEMLLSMKRAGADIIITYYALEASRWLRGE
ncbi:porphobilinogen synthase [Clostridium omnivorum]|uniref:Delta-aminolevulinic acid dehydratase n=1 Tax=Clostridium omnivorum TaxID=1604902 RepID=A0ABQ5N318_9CLOT|nr:porphobilinogen synthase [Clostridium sp. E14]GLC29544.1 delta-aminolevulinic acid dehydratase [Clostridium sp. E14]